MQGGDNESQALKQWEHRLQEKDLLADKIKATQFDIEQLKLEFDPQYLKKKEEKKRAAERKKQGAAEGAKSPDKVPLQPR